MISSKIKVVFFLTSLLPLLYINCSVGDIAGSSGSETVNTHITVAERHGVIKRGATVRLVNPDRWFQNVAIDSSPVIYSAVSDSDGNVEIPEEIINSYKTVNLVVDCQNKGTFSSLELGKHFNNDTIYLEQHGTLAGALSYKGEVPSYVALMGTDYKAPFCLETSTFSFKSVPPGTYTLISVSKSSTKTLVKLAEAGTQIIIEGEDVNSEYACDYTSLLIDNFNHEGYWSPISKFQKKAFWFIVKSPSFAVSFPTTREIDTSYITVMDALVSLGAYEGKALHLEYTFSKSPYFDYNPDTDYLVPGVRVGFDSIGFSNIDTVSFMAKGNDQLTLRLHGDEVFWAKPQALYKVTLDTAWRMYKIPTSSMLIVDPTHLYSSWDKVKSKLYWITFLVEGKGNSVWIDDVKLNHATINDLLFR
jgi:hypothetical protein